MAIPALILINAAGKFRSRPPPALTQPRRRVPLGQGPPGDALGSGGAQDLVIDVGNVPAVGHRVAGGLQPAYEDVEADRRAKVPKMRRPLDGRAAHVDGCPPGHDGLKVANLPSCGIVQAERHPAEATGSELAPLCQRHSSLSPEIVPIKDQRRYRGHRVIRKIRANQPS